MITHNSFKLIMDAKDREADELRRELAKTKDNLERFKRERDTVFKRAFGRPVIAIAFIGDGVAEVETENGEKLIFAINLVGEVQE